MCGFAGYISLTDNFEVDPELLKKIHTVIEHRGPDGFGVFFSEQHKVAITHRRLSIIDLSAAGQQPMLDHDKTVLVAFNGEIYNYQTLKKELELLGHSFKTQTDTEVLLFAFKQWGIACLDKLEGMFAGVLGNLHTHEWFFIRDRMGVKPLYFTDAGGYFSFASEPKSLFELPWIQKELSSRGLYHYLTYMVAPAPWTLFKNIYKLPTGHYAKLDAQKNLSFHEWYNPLVPKIKYSQHELQDEQFCVQEIRRLLRAAVKKRMISDVSFGVFLSGGIDSSLNVALMAELTSQVKTFNIAFKDGPEYAETQWARKVAHQFGTQHHELEIDETDAYNFFAKMVHHQDDPIADCVCIPLYYVSKLLKDAGVTVVQVGEGSDELFCGYQNYVQYLDTYRRYYQPTTFIPQPVKQVGYWTAARLFPRHQYRLGLLQQWASGQHLFWTGALAFSEQQKQELVNLELEPEEPMVNKIYPDFVQNYDSYNIVNYHLQQLHHKDPQADFLQSMIYLELKQRLPELLLMRVDKMTMACSVEARVPFLDHHLVEFALQIPTSLKYKNNITKYILKKACEGILPPDVIYRPKMGFAAPISRWFKTNGPIQNLFADQLKNSKVTVIKKEKIAQLLHATKTGKTDYCVPLWVINNVLATGVV